MREPRALRCIADEISSILKQETGNAIAIGGLLTEAKSQIAHGDWLPWLEKNFRFSKSTAHNYVRAHAFAAKYPIVGNLKIRDTALYMLAADDFEPTALAKIFDVAKTEWVDAKKAKSIQISEICGPAPAPPPPPLPPPSPLPAPPPRDMYLREKFEEAVKELEKLATRPSEKFTGIVEPGRLEMLANFLRQIAAAAKRAA